MGKLQTPKPRESGQTVVSKTIENYPAYKYKNVFLSNQFMRNTY